MHSEVAGPPGSHAAIAAFSVRMAPMRSSERAAQEGINDVTPKRVQVRRGSPWSRVWAGPGESRSPRAPSGGRPASARRAAARQAAASCAAPAHQSKPRGTRALSPLCTGGSAQVASQFRIRRWCVHLEVSIKTGLLPEGTVSQCGRSQAHPDLAKAALEVSSKKRRTLS